MIGSNSYLLKVQRIIISLLVVLTFTVGQPVLGLASADMSQDLQAKDQGLIQGPSYMPLRPDLLKDYLQQEGSIKSSLNTTEAGFSSTMDVAAETKSSKQQILDGSIKPALTGARLAPTRDSSGKLLAPQLGVKKDLVIMIDFTDLGFDAVHNNSYYNNLLFGSGNSMTSYYKEQSYGRCTVEGTVLGPYTSSHPIAYYATDSNTDQYLTDDANVPIYELAREAVQLAKAANPDFNWDGYDSDGDGYIDAVTIIHAGTGQEEVPAAMANSTIWSHQWAIAGGEEIAAGKRVESYNMDPETGQVGVFAHEFGHVLGLPDLYDPQYQIEGAGDWELMASGSWNGLSTYGDCPAGLSAWSKHYLGWLDYTAAGSDQLDVVFPAIQGTPYALRLWTDGTQGNYYYLVENRQKTGYDAALPGEGLLIWWVGYPERYIYNNSVNTNPPTMMPIEADGKSSLWRGLNDVLSNRGDAGDPFPGTNGNRAFTFTSTPNSRVNKAYTGVSLWDIHVDPSDSSRYMADITVNNGLLLEPHTQSPDSLILGGPAASLNYVLLNDNTKVTIQVLNKSNTVVRTLLNAVKQNKGAQTVIWNGKNNLNQNVPVGNYTFKITTVVTNPQTFSSVTEVYSKSINVLTATASSDASLKGLRTSAGILTPVFSANTLSYDVAVANSVASITITPTVNESHATVTVNGIKVNSGYASGAIALAAGTPKAIPVVVTAQNGMKQTYTVTVIRAAAGGGGGTGTGVSLSSLTLSWATLKPSFSGDVTSYTATVPKAITSIKVTPTASDSTATITINGMQVKSGSYLTVSLPTIGSKTIRIVVASADQSSIKTYTITVTKSSTSSFLK